MRPASWRVERAGVTQVAVGGPVVDALIRNVLTDLADGIDDGDTLADAWSQWVVFRGRLVDALANGPAEEIEQLSMECDAAWLGLDAELGHTLRMQQGQACELAEQLDDVAGRAGTAAA